ncbi:LOW QUALITY PROTEIN: uncharacterized protein KIAA2012 homolog [Alca torda]
MLNLSQLNYGTGPVGKEDQEKLEEPYEPELSLRGKREVGACHRQRRKLQMELSTFQDLTRAILAYEGKQKDHKGTRWHLYLHFLNKCDNQIDRPICPGCSSKRYLFRLTKTLTSISISFTSFTPGALCYTSKPEISGCENLLAPSLHDLISGPEGTAKQHQMAIGGYPDIYQDNDELCTQNNMPLLGLLPPIVVKKDPECQESRAGAKAPSISNALSDSTSKAISVGSVHGALLEEQKESQKRKRQLVRILLRQVIEPESGSTEISQSSGNAEGDFWSKNNNSEKQYAREETSQRTESRKETVGSSFDIITPGEGFRSPSLEPEKYKLFAAFPFHHSDPLADRSATRLNVNFKCVINYIPVQIPPGKWQEERSAQEKVRAEKGKRQQLKVEQKRKEQEQQKWKKKEQQEQMEKVKADLEKEQQKHGGDAVKTRRRVEVAAKKSQLEKAAQELIWQQQEEEDYHRKLLQFQKRYLQEQEEQVVYRKANDYSSCRQRADLEQHLQFQALLIEVPGLEHIQHVPCPWLFSYFQLLEKLGLKTIQKNK